MIKKMLICSVLIFFGFLAKADNEKGRKAGSEKDGKEIVIDSVSGDTLYFEINHSDDTLVFEDWEGSGSGMTDNSILTGQENNDGPSTNLNGISETIGDLIANTKKRYEVKFTVFPNPVSNELHIQAENSPQEIKVFSLNGKQMDHGGQLNIIDVRGYENGIYLIELIYPDHIESRKFVKY